MRRFRAIPPLVVFIILPVFVLGGCKKGKPTSEPIANYVRFYYILDFQASEEWKATHRVTATWRNETLSLPAAFTTINKGSCQIRIVDDGSCEVTIFGDPVTFDIQPGCDLKIAIIDDFQIVPAGGTVSGSSISLPHGEKLKFVSYNCLAPSGDTTATAPSQAEVEKLLQNHVIDAK